MTHEPLTYDQTVKASLWLARVASACDRAPGDVPAGLASGVRYWAGRDLPTALEIATDAARHLIGAW
jgi:hypothetical protein